MMSRVFISFYAFFLTTVALAGPVKSPVTHELEPYECDIEKYLPSKHGEIPVELQIKNDSSETIEAYWINYDGKRDNKRIIGPNSMHKEHTYVTQAWIILSKEGECKGVYLPEPGQSAIVITKSGKPKTALSKKHQSSKMLQGCETEKNLKSDADSTKKSLQFSNQSKNSVKLFWLDYEGKRKHYSTIKPGESFYTRTYISHPWVIADEKDQCVSVYPNQDDGIGIIDVQ